MQKGKLKRAMSAVLVAGLLLSNAVTTSAFAAGVHSNVPHETGTIDWNTLTEVPPNAAPPNFLNADLIEPKPAKFATVDCYVEDENGNVKTSQKWVYIYNGNARVSLGWEWEKFYAYTACDLKIDNGNLTPPELHNIAFASNVYDGSADSFGRKHITHSDVLTSNSVAHVAVQLQDGTISEGFLASDLALKQISQSTSTKFEAKVKPDAWYGLFDIGRRLGISVDNSSNSREDAGRYCYLNLERGNNGKFSIRDVGFFSYTVAAGETKMLYLPIYCCAWVEDENGEILYNQMSDDQRFILIKVKTEAELNEIKQVAKAAEAEDEDGVTSHYQSVNPDLFTICKETPASVEWLYKNFGSALN